MILLSILIPSTYDREKVTRLLTEEIHRQCIIIGFENKVEIIVNFDNKEKPTGTKRNELVSNSRGLYVCQFDSDDWPSKDYIFEIFKAMVDKPDAIGMRGWIETDGANRIPWSISKDHPYTTETSRGGKPVRYLRHTNHLSPIRREIAIQVPYPDIYFGEDYAYSVALKESGLVNTEVYIDKEIYFYKYSTQK